MSTSQTERIEIDLVAGAFLFVALGLAAVGIWGWLGRPAAALFAAVAFLALAVGASVLANRNREESAVAGEDCLSGAGDHPARTAFWHFYDVDGNTIASIPAPASGTFALPEMPPGTHACQYVVTIDGALGTGVLANQRREES